jgi:hypothetical protein
MAFFDWRYLFNEIFQEYPDDWRLNYVHRNELNRIQGLQNHRKMSREKFALYVNLIYILLLVLVFVVSFVNDVQIDGHQRKLR